MRLCGWRFPNIRRHCPVDYVAGLQRKTVYAKVVVVEFLRIGPFAADDSGLRALERNVDELLVGDLYDGDVWLNLKTAVGGEFFLTQRRREAENAEKIANL
jgi:hypothetical protein